LLYVLQWSGNGKVRRYELDGTFVDEFTSAGVPQSIGIDWDDDGNLYVSSYSARTVRKFDSTGNDLGVFVGSNLAGPTNIWFDDNADLLVIDYNGTAVKRFDTTGTFANNFLTGLSNAEGVAFLPNGNILIGNGATHSVKEFDSSGNYAGEFIPNGSGGLITPNAIVIRQSITTSVSNNNSLTEKSFMLEQNYPNPFNPGTTISWQSSVGSWQTLKVYDVLGNEVATLINEFKAAGKYDLEFDSEDLTSGIYFYQIRAGQFVETKKMILLK
jgi:hypothetical protein